MQWCHSHVVAHMPTLTGQAWTESLKRQLQRYAHSSQMANRVVLLEAVLSGDLTIFVPFGLLTIVDPKPLTMSLMVI